MLEITVENKLPIGISSCLLGNTVRFDGGHKRDAYIQGTLSRYFEFLPICPEISIGLGMPREPLRLVRQDDGTTRAMGVRTQRLDVTERLEYYGRQVLPTISHVRGYILKSKSPSCGMRQVKVYSKTGTWATKGSGIFSRLLMEHHPLVPFEEESRLGDRVLRENFLERVFTYDRWLNLLDGGLNPAQLKNFHAGHKLLVMSHSSVTYRRLGRLIAVLSNGNVQDMAETYAKEMMESLKRETTRKSHTYVLQHLSGYLKKVLDSKEKQEMFEVIDAYKKGKLSLIVPFTLLKQHFRRYPQLHVKSQYYLYPHPVEFSA